MTNRIGFAAGVALPLAITSQAMAHPGHEVLGDLSSGFIHPLSGPDHLLAILACGALAAVLAGRAVWIIPALFTLAMLAGGVLGALGAWTAHAEHALVLSVPAICLLLVPRLRVGLPLAAATTILAGLLHGAAHGAELQAGMDPFGYFAGFVACTAVLLGSGVALVQLCLRITAPERYVTDRTTSRP